ncbi:ArgE/DapE family deacylase [Microbispora cellulosiformans]|uniref:Probable succinyl-diaminopimelate desuccinylase n=1 Tax=Microbispora cellulosiformans TaxID=2614688 RepID=A0A5J5K7U0_9ACTN|nr:ArgE/DapE family deacylase [Microbispora cellulosiformans]KAA9380820.1 ArgE/DapE family deacylase [Microbispora cellulosiformans]
MNSQDGDVTRRVLDEVDGLATRMVASLADAISVPSVNPRYPGQEYDKVVGAEGDMSALLAHLYSEAGAGVTNVTMERGRDNAVGVVPGAGGGRSLLLNGHVDVVPAGRLDRWNGDPFRAVVTDDTVIGRGATDMKGGLVAAAYAAVALRRAGVRLAGDLVLQAVVGEEVGDHEAGTTAVLEAGFGADAAIVCEPSGQAGTLPASVPVTPGLLWFSITMEGKTAHSGLRGMTVHPTLEGDALGVNTVDKFWIVYQALRALEDEWARHDRHPLFPPGYFNLLPGVLRANPSGILVPFFLADELTVEYCVYHHPDRSNEEVMAEIESRVADACRQDPWLRAHPPVFDWKLLWPPYALPGDAPIGAALASAHTAAAGQAPVTTGFMGVCDLTWMDRKGIGGLVYGPGVGYTAHAENEYVEIAQLVQSAKTYAITAINWCGLAETG